VRGDPGWPPRGLGVLGQTLKVWDLDFGASFVAHWANTAFTAVTTTASAIIAGDAAGTVWFLDWPPSITAL
jgi:hypothetical protein